MTNPASAAARRRPTNSTEVARRAQVSRATVSYVLNAVQTERITPATRARVEQAARELGYTLHPAAPERTHPPVVLLLGVEQMTDSLAELVELTEQLGCATVVWCGDHDSLAVACAVRPAVAICPVAVPAALAETLREHQVPLINGNAAGRSLERVPSDPTLARTWFRHLVDRAAAMIADEAEKDTGPRIDRMVHSVRG